MPDPAGRAKAFISAAVHRLHLDPVNTLMNTIVSQPRLRCATTMKCILQETTRSRRMRSQPTFPNRLTGASQHSSACRRLPPAAGAGGSSGSMSVFSSTCWRPRLQRDLDFPHERTGKTRESHGADVFPGIRNGLPCAVPTKPVLAQWVAKLVGATDVEACVAEIIDVRTTAAGDEGVIGKTLADVRGADRGPGREGASSPHGDADDQ